MEEDSFFDVRERFFKNGHFTMKLWDESEGFNIY